MAEPQNLISHFFLDVEGMPESAGVELMQGLLSVVIESSLHLPDVATIRVTDTALRWIDDKKRKDRKPKVRIHSSMERSSSSSRSLSSGRTTSPFARSTSCTVWRADVASARSST